MCLSCTWLVEVEPPPPNTARSMPAEKCLPVELMTMQRARALWSMSFTITGSSFQNSRLMEFMASGRFNWIWATPSSRVTLKQANWAVVTSVMVFPLVGNIIVP